MKEEIRNIVNKIDEYIRHYDWFDFHITKYDGQNLIVGGNLSPSYSDMLEITFQDVFFIQGFFQGWHSNTKTSVFQITENEVELNQKFEIEQGYQLFSFKTEDYKNDIFIAAKNISFAIKNNT